LADTNVAYTQVSARARLAHHFDNLEQQREAGTLGMWVFLITEVMFFGGLFTAYTIYRIWHPIAFAEASNYLDITLGAFNTAVLICSSLTMALAVYNSQVGNRRRLVFFLILTILLGLTFIAVKGVEYNHKYEETFVPGPSFNEKGLIPAAEVVGASVYFSLYFAMTGLHALHMIVGVAVVSVITVMAWRGKFSPDYHAPVELTGLYWHFVDIVWIFLFPLLYLIGRHTGGAHNG
jgi:cytochrome c oxidase subunit 3